MTNSAGSNSLPSGLSRIWASLAHHLWPSCSCASAPSIFDHWSRLLGMAQLLGPWSFSMPPSLGRDQAVPPHLWTSYVAGFFFVSSFILFQSSRAWEFDVNLFFQDNFIGSQVFWFKPAKKVTGSYLKTSTWHQWML